MKKQMRTLPSFDSDRSLQVNPLLAQGTSGTIQETIQETTQEMAGRILDLIRRNPSITIERMAEKLGMTRAGINRVWLP